MNRLRRPQPTRPIRQRLPASALCWGLLLSCANDVVLGEHLATSSTTSSAVGTTSVPTGRSDSSEASTVDESTRCPFYAFPDGGKPDNNDDRRDEGDWRRDGGLLFDDCWPLDGGPHPPINPERPMGEDDPFGMKPISVEPRPGDPLAPNPSSPLDSFGTPPDRSDDFSG